MDEPFADTPRNVTVIGVRGIASAEAFGTGRIVGLVSGDTLIQGYLEALGRLKEKASARTDLVEVYLPLFETLNWVVAIQDRTDDRSDPLMRTLRFVRNRVHHQWAQAIDPQSIEPPEQPRGDGIVATSNIGGTAPLSRWVWADTHQLPPADRGREDPEGEADYAQQLARQPMLRVLNELQRRFQD